MRRTPPPRARSERRCGWTVITDVDRARTTTTIAWGVPVGSRDEPRWTHLGLTHLLEHLAFLGRSGKTPLGFDAAVDAIGADANAETWEEGVAFHVTVAPDDAGAAAEVLAATTCPTLERDVVARERGIVIEELLEVDRDPTERAYAAAVELALPRHPLARRVAGRVGDVRGVPQGWLAAWLRWWRAVIVRHPGKTLVVVGPGEVGSVADRFLDAARAVERASGLGVRPARVRERTAPRAWSARRRDVVTHDLERAHVAWLRPGCSASDPRVHLAEALAALLGDVNVGAARPLWLETGLVDDVFFDHVGWDDGGAFVGGLVCAAGDVDDRVDEIRSLWSDVVPSALTPERWHTVTALMAFDRRSLLESTEALALAHLDAAFHRRPLLDVDREAHAIEQLPFRQAENLVLDVAHEARRGADAVAVLRPS